MLLGDTVVKGGWRLGTVHGAEWSQERRHHEPSGGAELPQVCCRVSAGSHRRALPRLSRASTVKGKKGTAFIS